MSQILLLLVDIHTRYMLVWPKIGSTRDDDWRIFIVEIPNLKNCNFL